MQFIYSSAWNLRVRFALDFVAHKEELVTVMETRWVVKIQDVAHDLSLRHLSPRQVLTIAELWASRQRLRLRTCYFPDGPSLRPWQLAVILRAHMRVIFVVRTAWMLRVPASSEVFARIYVLSFLPV